MSDILELLKSDSRKGNLLSLQAAEWIERLEGELVRTKSDCAFWKSIARSSLSENLSSNANNR